MSEAALRSAHRLGLGQGERGPFANIKRRSARSTHRKGLRSGKHPLQLYSLAPPNGVKVTVCWRECWPGHSGASKTPGCNIGSGESVFDLVFLVLSFWLILVAPHYLSFLFFFPALMDRSGPLEFFPSGVRVRRAPGPPGRESGKYFPPSRRRGPRPFFVQCFVGLCG